MAIRRGPRPLKPLETCQLEIQNLLLDTEAEQSAGFLQRTGLRCAAESKNTPPKLGMTG